MSTVTVQRVVFPAGFQLPAASADIEGLYLKRSIADPEEPEFVPTLRPTVVDRTSAYVPRGAVLSTDTYFNRLHAGYWRRWSDIDRVTASIGGDGNARMTVRRSTASGVEVTVAVVEGPLSEGLRWEVDLAPLAAGGCLWLEVESLDDHVVVSDGRWTVDREPPEALTDIAVCTFDRPKDVLALLRSLRSEPECLSMIGRVWIVDNGTQQFTHLEGGQEEADAWGERLAHLSQPNLGGSGGFSRGMYEAAFHGDAAFVTLLDDDVVVEPEGLRRQVLFAALATRPIAVGGHMLNRAEPAVLHSSAEWIDTQTMRWGPAPGGEESIDLEEDRLDYVLDSAYNAWWCCLIPTEAIREVGLSLPFFIKYDDAEFGYRLARAGYRTVSLPGSAVWHEPWTLKDDTTDWTLYFHVRNRLIFTALMSAGLPEKVRKRRVAVVLKDVMKRDIVRNVLRRAYASAASADLAMRDFMVGPQILHEPLQDAVARVRAFRADYPDAQTGVPTSNAGDKPTAIMRTKRPLIPLGLPRSVLREYGVPVPKILPIPVHLLAKKKADPWLIWSMPEASHEVAELPKAADSWWGLVDLPDAWVTTVDGAKVTRRTRQPELSRALTKQAWATAKEVRQEFDRLCDEYAADYPQLVHPRTWAKQFGIPVDE